EAMRDALEASGAELVTVALRRADLTGKKDPFANILEFIDPNRYLLLPNTSGAMIAEEALRLARLAAAAGQPKWSFAKNSPSSPTSMPTLFWPNVCRTSAWPPSCRSVRPSVPIVASRRV